jgi:hypothetical protein
MCALLPFFKRGNSGSLCDGKMSVMPMFRQPSVMLIWQL